MKINLVMIVKNEQRSLERCLDLSFGLVDEIVIVDTGSTDDTKKIAEKFGAKIYDFVWCNDFSAARNFALDQSDADWNLILDADEYLRPIKRAELESQIRHLEKSLGGSFLGALSRYDIYFEADGATKSSSVSSLARLLPKGVRYTGKIHEQPDTSLPAYLLAIEADHDGYLFENKGERNLPYLQEAVIEKPQDSYYHFQLAMTLRNLGRLRESLPEFRIFYELTKEETGYRTEGVLLYLYTLLDLEEKDFLEEAFEVIQKEENRLGNRSDYHFVCGVFYMKYVLSDIEKHVSYLPKIEQSYLTCLQIGEHPELGGVVGTGSFKAWYNLGIWYEVSGNPQKAKYCYEQAAKLGYEPAKQRM